MCWAPTLENTREIDDFHFGIVDIVGTVDTADIVHTVDILDNVKSVNSVDNVSSANTALKPEA